MERENYQAKQKERKGKAEGTWNEKRKEEKERMVQSDESHPSSTPSYVQMQKAQSID